MGATPCANPLPHRTAGPDRTGGRVPAEVARPTKAAPSKLRRLEDPYSPTAAPCRSSAIRGKRVVPSYPKSTGLLGTWPNPLIAPRPRSSHTPQSCMLSPKWHSMGDDNVVPKFQVGEEVYVPASCLTDPNAPQALVRRRVLRNVSRSIVVDDHGGRAATIASGLAHHNSLGILVLRIGDLSTETTLLDPPAESVARFLRLLIGDENIEYIQVRTLAELEMYWSKGGAPWSHVILICHGGKNSVTFVGDGQVEGGNLAARLVRANPAAIKKRFISLACKTGRAERCPLYDAVGLGVRSCDDYCRGAVHSQKKCLNGYHHLYLDRWKKLLSSADPCVGWLRR